MLCKDLLITKTFLPGPVLIWNSFGCRFINHLSEISIVDQLFEINNDITNKRFNNVVILNCVQNRYLTVTEMHERIQLLYLLLNSAGRLIVGFNSIFLNWNRCAFSLTSQLDEFERLILNNGFLVKHKIIKPYQTDAFTGDCFFIFEKL